MKNQTMSDDAVSQLSDADIALMLARESLRRFGTPIPPPGALMGLSSTRSTDTSAASETPIKRRAVPATIGPNDTHKCSRCGEVKNILRDFGLRNVNGVVRKQSQCYACRSLSRSQRIEDRDKRLLARERKKKKP